MARYRSKDDVDLRWNQIRRRLTRELDIQIADWREPALDALLSGAWEKFKDALSKGEMLQLEADYESWVSRALEQSVSIKPVDDAVE